VLVAPPRAASGRSHAMAISDANRSAAPAHRTPASVAQPPPAAAGPRRTAASCPDPPSAGQAEALACRPTPPELAISTSSSSKESHPPERPWHHSARMPFSSQPTSPSGRVPLRPRLTNWWRCTWIRCTRAGLRGRPRDQGRSA
jgi:hypothetical protein